MYKKINYLPNGIFPKPFTQMGDTVSDLCFFKEKEAQPKNRRSGQFALYKINEISSSAASRSYWDIKKAIKSTDFIALVPHAGVEPAIYCVRGSCPGPLDECGLLVSA